MELLLLLINFNKIISLEENNENLNNSILKFINNNNYTINDKKNIFNDYLINLTNKEVIFDNLLNNETIEINNINYILDHKIYLFIHLNNTNNPILIKEMDTNTEFINLNKKNNLEIKNINLFKKVIQEILKIKEKNTTKFHISKFNSIFFLIRYQKINTTNFLNSIFFLNENFYKINLNGFKVEKILSTKIENMKNFFLLILINQIIEYENNNILITENEENYQSFLIQNKKLLKDNFNSSLINKTFKKQIKQFLLNSNYENIINLDENTRKYFNELKIETKIINDSINKYNKRIEKELNFKNVFLKNQLL